MCQYLGIGQIESERKKRYVFRFYVGKNDNFKRTLKKNLSIKDDTIKK